MMKTFHKMNRVQLKWHAEQLLSNMDTRQRRIQHTLQQLRQESVQSLHQHPKLWALGAGGGVLALWLWRRRIVQLPAQLFGAAQLGYRAWTVAREHLATLKSSR